MHKGFLETDTSMSKSTTVVKLNNGINMPLFGLGTWQSKPEEVKTAVTTALDAGYRLIDTAYNYQNEDVIGEGIAEKLKGGKLKREDLFITTKLGNILTRPSDVQQSMSESLKKLRLSYVDLFLIHIPVVLKKQADPKIVFPFKDGQLDHDGPVDFEGVWKEMEKLVDEGKAKSIGVSNFNVAQVERIMKCARIKPVVNQVECHAYFPQNKLEAAMKKHNIAIMAYSPIGSPGSAAFTTIPGEAPLPVLLKDPVVAGLATKYKKSPAQILIRNLLQRNLIVIPKSVTPSRIRENGDVFDFKLSPEDMTAIAGINKELRLLKFHMMSNAPDFPFNDLV
ncbi:alcohol dehydrogenase [NADP(+)] A-like isoform X2 [Mizuhopecten yessoensis]|uniref:alcohol dehydrogenase [NADP(+)] A-like isoform X2 n=1 Tax=Mizuhopecten yessoensis TaxID=6573 RepID=UPI000B45841F|nr:alcohol dehydrogenase [NADP(+)] A-like isoform X2 [Mizuhopecten yessoensis]